MKFKILDSVAYESLENHVAAELRGPLPPRSSAQYTLLVFPPGRIVHGRIAAKAARRLPTDLGIPILAIAGSFTEEAQDILRTAGAMLIGRRPFLWTDSSLDKIRVLVGANAKRPDHR